MNGFDPAIITWTDLALAFLLILISLGVSSLFKLKIAGPMFTGAFRSFLQLTLLGYVLQFIFGIDRFWHFLLLLSAIILFAGYEGSRRQLLKIPGYYWMQVSVIAFSTTVVMGLILGLILDLEPWFNPVVSIPLAGMTMGQSLNSSSMLAKTLGTQMQARQQEIELRLSLGATRWQAVLPLLRDSVHTALIPSLNSLNTVGIVSIPGVLAGALIGGMQPMVAIKYQIMVMYLWVSGTTLACAGMALILARTFLNTEHQLRRDLLRQSPGTSK